MAKEKSRSGKLPQTHANELPLCFELILFSGELSRPSQAGKSKTSRRMVLS
jgi:hypothetical protein